jgi:hypothetical protein
MVRMTTPIDPAGQSAGTGAPSGTEGSTTSPAGSTPSAQSGATDGQTNAPATVSREDFERIQNQLRAADQRRDAAEKEAQKLKDANLSEADRQAKALKDTQAENEALKASIQELRIQNAFVTDNTHDWHDAKAALKLADLSGVTIEDDGTVKGLKEALEAVAKSSPYLLKPKAEADDDKGKQTPPAGVSGVAGGGNGASGNDKNALARKFPQLAGRVSTGS